MNNWTSHLGQDAWVALCLDRRDGYYLDFGAFDGVSDSNTFCLENNYGWRGICVEPNPTAYAQLCRHRHSICVPAAVVESGGPTMTLVDAHGLSALEGWAARDRNAKRRAEATLRTVTVRTVQPLELLTYFDVPERIDYLSMDVEGPEVEILEAVLAIPGYRIAMATIEHNCEAEKQRVLRSMMNAAGYRVVEGHTRHDDFYWLPDMLPVGCDPQAVFNHVQNALFK